jgi:hypothetical protein
MAIKKNLEILKSFIKDNCLSFRGMGSGLNAECVVLAGYMSHLDIDRTDGVEIINALFSTHEVRKEATKVFYYALDNNYGAKWKTKEYKKMYKF